MRYVWENTWLNNNNSKTAHFLLWNLARVQYIYPSKSEVRQTHPNRVRWSCRYGGEEFFPRAAPASVTSHLYLHSSHECTADTSKVLSENAYIQQIFAEGTDVPDNNPGIGEPVEKSTDKFPFLKQLTFYQERCSITNLRSAREKIRVWRDRWSEKDHLRR